MGMVRDFFSEIGVLLSSIKVQDVFDILIVAVLLYYIFTFIRDRRAGKLILGVALLLIIQMISTWFGLLTVNYILGNFVSVGVLAIIILFQPEFRSALEKVGSDPLSSFKMIAAKNAAQVQMEMIDSVCEASCQMAKDKTGALIVIERKTKLGEYIGSGTVINADPSAPMLENLFFKNSPLHDGAVIIRDARVYAAGCFLPLSQSDVCKDLGTRHHAAVGVSEVSDAIVIVVSEQTGTISAALGGKLRRNLDYVTLHKFLQSLLIESQDGDKNGKKKKKIKKKDNNENSGEQIAETGAVVTADELFAGKEDVQ